MNARDEDSPETEPMRMRNVVPAVDQSSLVGCSDAGIGFIAAEQKRTPDGDCATLRDKASVDLQLASCRGKRRISELANGRGFKFVLLD